MTDFTKMNEAIKTATSGKGIKGFAKKLTYAIIIVAFLIGVLGSFTFIPFDMEAYVSFLPAIGLLIIPLIISIGASSVTDKIQQGKKEREMAVAHEIKNQPDKVDGAVG